MSLLDAQKMAQKKTASDFQRTLVQLLEASKLEDRRPNALAEAGLLKYKIEKLNSLTIKQKKIRYDNIKSLEQAILLEATNAIIQCLASGGMVFGQDISRQVKDQNIARKLGIKSKVFTQIPNQIKSQCKLIWPIEEVWDHEMEAIYNFNSTLFFHEKTSAYWGYFDQTLTPITKKKAETIAGFSM